MFMSENEAAKPLKVSIVRRPPIKGGGLGNEIAIEKGAGIVREVLENLKYDGTWTLAFTRQTKKRYNIKFQVSRRYESRGIMIRTKPFDNSTCWESILTPPEKYDPKEVMSTLERVHVTKLTAKQLTPVDIEKVFSPKPVSIFPTDQSPTKTAVLAKKTLKDMILSFSEGYPKGFKIESFIKEFRQVGIKPHEEKRLSSLVRETLNALVAAGIMTRDVENRYGKPSKDFPEVISQLPVTRLEKLQEEKAALNEVDEEIKNRLEQKMDKTETQATQAKQFKLEKLNVEKEKIYLDLTLPYDYEAPLHKNKNAISIALVALYVGLGKDTIEGRVILPSEITNVLTTKLKLDQYVENQDNYRKEEKVASALTKGLVQEGFLHREQYNGRVDRHTRYLVFTVKGLDEAETLVKKFQKLVANNKLPLKPVDTATAVPIAVNHVPTPQDSMDMLTQTAEENAANLQPLIKELEKIQASIITFDDIEKQAKLDLSTTLDATSAVQSRIQSLTEQLQELNERMSTYQTQEKQLNSDLNDIRLNREEEKKRMTEIKLKIISILKIER
jgi:hypothetical protein